jgi:hypothetical protein
MNNRCGELGTMAVPVGLKSPGALLPRIALIVAVLTLAACGDKPQPPAPPAKLFQQERGALDKAKGEEQTEAKSAEDLKREEEKQTK